jgi:hypothetical protein
MNIWLSYHWHALALAFKRLALIPFSTLLTLGVIGIAFSLPAGIYVFLENVETLSGQFSSGPQLSVFLKLNATQSEVGKIESFLKENPHLASFSFIPKASGLEQFNVVGGYKYGNAYLMKRFENSHDILCILRIQIARWLIGDEYRRSADNGARDAQPLLLSARKRDGARFLLTQQSHLIERGAHPPDSRFRLETADLQGKQNILKNAAVEQQLLILKHQSEVAAQERNSGAIESADILAIDDNAAGGGTLDRGNEPQQRCLSCSRMAVDQGHLPCFYCETDIPECLETVGVALGNLTETDHLLARRAGRVNSISTPSFSYIP